MSLDPAVGGILRLDLALLFGASAVHKARDPAAFRATLADYRLLPSRAVGAAALGVAGLEALGALLVLTPAGREPGAALLALLLVSYAGAIAINLARGRRDIDCGCAGPGARQSLGEGLVARNLALALAAGACWLPPGGRALHAVDAVTVVLGAASGAVLYLAVDRLLANRSRLRGLRV